MSYLVLARKYRPQTFAEMVGQEHVTRTLGNAFAAGRVHHAFLFCGARGVGKTTAARILAKCLSCVNAPTATPCNACEACLEIVGGTSVDVQEIDGASNGLVDDIRTLRENVRYLPVRGKKKVYIIDEVHMVSTAGFNALLKTLEEPPPHAAFVFATTEAHKIPITILSRVQRYDFRLVSSRRIIAHLSKVLGDEKIAFDPGALAVIAREAGGSVRDALSLLEQVLAVGGGAGEGGAVCSEQAAAEALGVADRSLIIDLGRAILARDGAGAMALVGAACDRSVDFKHLSHALLEHLRNLVVARVVPDPGALIEGSENELADLQATAKAAPAGLLELLFDRFARVTEEVARSPLPRFVFEVGLIELTYVEPLEPVGELVDRLEQLESRLATPTGAGAAAPARPGPLPVPAPRPVAPRGPLARPPTLSGSAPPPPPPTQRPTSWQTLAEQLFARSHRFAVLLHGKEVSFAPPKLVVAFKNGFEATQAREKLPDALPLIQELLGVATVVEIVEGTGHEPSAIEAEDQRALDERAKKRQEAIDHPARKLIAKQFGDGVTFKEPEVE
ncbi:MAG: DNA polymerase III subunit gamma/tau [Myxococcales bacterium]|nr:DNA polymerase III subunit gamma/tau [Myxococcales bacterium]